MQGGGAEREDRWNGYEKHKSISVLMRAARDGSHATMIAGEGRGDGKTLGWNKKGLGNGKSVLEHFPFGGEFEEDKISRELDLVPSRIVRARNFAPHSLPRRSNRRRALGVCLFARKRHFVGASAAIAGASRRFLRPCRGRINSTVSDSRRGEEENRV